MSGSTDAPRRRTHRATPWSSEEIRLLRRYAKTMTIAQAAVRLRRNRHTVTRKAQQLGIRFQKRGRVHHFARLDTADLTRIFDLRRQGYLLREIADETSVSPSYISRLLNYERRYAETLS